MGTISSNDEFTNAIESTAKLSRVLDSMGFSGLWNTGTQGAAAGIKAECFELTEKLIEASRKTQRYPFPDLIAIALTQANFDV